MQHGPEGVVQSNALGELCRGVQVLHLLPFQSLQRVQIMQERGAVRRVRSCSRFGGRCQIMQGGGSFMFHQDQ